MFDRSNQSGVISLCRFAQKFDALFALKREPAFLAYLTDQPMDSGFLVGQDIMQIPRGNGSIFNANQHPTCSIVSRLTM
jgi:hypothetical protein